MMVRCSIVSVLVGLVGAASAGTPPDIPEPETPIATVRAPSMARAVEASTGARFRNGFSASVGQEFGSGPSDGLTGQLYGLDWRIGVKATAAISVYAHSHLSLGTASIGGTSGLTGNFAGALVAEYELPVRVFVGGGGGYGVLNNPSGPLGQLRAGWYPFPKSGDATSRRVNIALDARFYFAGEGIGTVSHYALSLGYDRF